MTLRARDHDSMTGLLLRAYSRTEALDAEERLVLDCHLQACSECGARYALMEAARCELRAQCFQIDASIVRATQWKVRRRTRQLRMQEEISKPVWIACAVAFSWTVASSPFLWEGFAWLGQSHNLPDAMWQTGFFLAWLMPAAVLSTIGIALSQRQKEFAR